MIQTLRPLLAKVKHELGGLRVQTSIYLREIEALVFARALTPQEADFLLCGDGDLPGLLDLCALRKAITGSLKNSSFYALQILDRLLHNHPFGSDKLCESFECVERDKYCALQLSSHCSGPSRESALRIARFIKEKHKSLPLDSYLVTAESREQLEQFIRQEQKTEPAQSKGFVQKPWEEPRIQKRVARELGQVESIRPALGDSEAEEIISRYKDPLQAALSALLKAERAGVGLQGKRKMLPFIHIDSAEFRPDLYLKEVYRGATKSSMVELAKALPAYVEQQGRTATLAMAVNFGVLWRVQKGVQQLVGKITSGESAIFKSSGNTVLLDELQVEIGKHNSQSQKFSKQLEAVNFYRKLKGLIAEHETVFEAPKLLLRLWHRGKHRQAVQLYRKAVAGLGQLKTESEELASVQGRRLEETMRGLRGRMMQKIVWELERPGQLAQSLLQFVEMYPEFAGVEQYFVAKLFAAVSNLIRLKFGGQGGGEESKEVAEFEMANFGRRVSLQRQESWDALPEFLAQEGLAPYDEFTEDRQFKRELLRMRAEEVLQVLANFNEVRLAVQLRKDRCSGQTLQVVARMQSRLLDYYCEELGRKIRALQSCSRADSAQLIEYVEFAGILEELFQKLQTWQLPQGERLAWTTGALLASCFQDYLAFLKTTTWHLDETNQLEVDFLGNRATTNLVFSLQEIVSFMARLAGSAPAFKRPFPKKGEAVDSFVKVWLKLYLQKSIQTRAFQLVQVELQALKNRFFVYAYAAAISGCLQLDPSGILKSLAELSDEFAPSLLNTYVEGVLADTRTASQLLFRGSQWKDIFNEIYRLLAVLQAQVLKQVAALKHTKLAEAAQAALLKSLVEEGRKDPTKRAAFAVETFCCLTNGLSSPEIEGIRRQARVLAESVRWQPEEQAGKKSLLVQHRFKNQALLYPLFVY